MANFWYTHGKAGTLGGINFATDDIRVLMVMTNTTCDTEEDKAFIDQFTTLDEFDGANNARKALTTEAVSADEGNDRGEFDADDVTWTALGAGTRQAAGLLLYKFVSDDSDSIPIAWIDDDFPITPGGGDVTITWNADGILQIT